MSEPVDIHSHKIMSMEKQKRERIINAAMAEFCKGYKKASTDEMVRAAGISKGLLFHYFGTKRELFRFLLWYALDVIITEYYDLINKSQKDLLERLWQLMLLKVDLSFKYPNVFEFLTVSSINKADETGENFMQQVIMLQTKLYAEMYADLDTSLFKEGMDVKKITDIVMWTLTGYSQSKISKEKKLEQFQQEYEQYLEEVQQYLAILRKAFYK